MTSRHTIEWRKLYSRPIWVILVGLTLLYVGVWILSRDKLIFTDEIVFAEDFARVARGAWAEAEIPHPPLYTGLGSIAVRLFGYTLPSLRLVGGLSFLAVLWLLPLACSALNGQLEHARRSGVIAALIWAVHPLALQGSLLLDIDNTLLPLAMLLLLLAFSLTETAPPAQRALWIALAWALMLWTKWLPSPLMLILALTVVLVLRRRQVLSALAGLALGSAVHGVSFVAFAILNDFPIDRLSITVNRTQMIAMGWQRAMSRLIMGGGITSVWIGIPFLISWLMLAIYRTRDLLRGAQITYRDGVLGFTLVGMTVYSIGNELPMGFPRYHYPVFLGIVILVSLALADNTTLSAAWQNKYVRLVWLTMSAACAVYFALVLPDPLLPQYALTFETNDLWTRLRFGAQLQMSALFIPFGLIAVACWILLRLVRVPLPALFTQRPLRSILFVAAAAFSAGSWIVTSTAQAFADYATIYEYGRHGGREMATLIAQRTAPDDRIIAPKEILWAAQRKGDFIVSLLVCPECTAERMIERFRSDPPAAFVLTTKEDGRYTHVTRDPAFVALLARCYEPRVEIGTYLTYFRVGDTCQ